MTRSSARLCVGRKKDRQEVSPFTLLSNHLASSGTPIIDTVGRSSCSFDCHCTNKYTRRYYFFSEIVAISHSSSTPLSVPVSYIIGRATLGATNHGRPLFALVSRVDFRPLTSDRQRSCGLSSSFLFLFYWVLSYYFVTTGMIILYGMMMTGVRVVLKRFRKEHSLPMTLPSLLSTIGPCHRPVLRHHVGVGMDLVPPCSGKYIASTSSSGQWQSAWRYGSHTVSFWIVLVVFVDTTDQ